MALLPELVAAILIKTYDFITQMNVKQVQVLTGAQRLMKITAGLGLKRATLMRSFGIGSQCWRWSCVMFFLLVAACLSRGVLAQAASGHSTFPVSEPALTVQWHLFSFPPAFIESGPYAGQGYQDRMLDYFEQRLPGVHIERRHSVLARALANIEHGGSACTGSLARTPEREKYMVFSRPVLVSLPLRLVVNQHQAERVRAMLDKDGVAHLADLGMLAALNGAVVKGRTYGAGVDTWLADVNTRGRVHTTARPELAFLMLARGRIDYTFAYPDEVGYFMRLHKGKDMMDSLVTIPLADVDGQPASHIACSNDAAGRAVIDAINKIMTQDAKAYGEVAPWQQPYLDWIEPAARADVKRLGAAKQEG